MILSVQPQGEQLVAGEIEWARLTAMMSAPDIPVRSAIVNGNPAHEILNAAGRERADFIVMGVDAKWHMDNGWNEDRAFQSFLLKSTVAKVVQGARCPVWLEQFSPSSGMRMSQLVCPLDLNRNCERLIRFASRIANEWTTELVLFHSTVSTRIFAPGQPRHTVDLQRHHIEMAENEIDQLQTRYSTSAAKVVATGDDVTALCKTLREYNSPLVVLERVSDRWGDNDKIFRTIRYCRTSVLIRIESEEEHVSVPTRRKRIDPFFVLLASIGIGVSIIYLAMYLATHADNCNFAAIRCQTPADVLFGTSSGGKPATPP